METSERVDQKWGSGGLSPSAHYGCYKIAGQTPASPQITDSTKPFQITRVGVTWSSGPGSRVQSPWRHTQLYPLRLPSHADSPHTDMIELNPN